MATFKELTTTSKCSVGELFIKKFSPLPHDILKPEKKVKTIQCAKLDDPFGGSYYCCVISGIPLTAHTLDGLKGVVVNRFSNMTAKYDEIYFVSH